MLTNIQPITNIFSDVKSVNLFSHYSKISERCTTRMYVLGHKVKLVAYPFFERKLRDNTFLNTKLVDNFLFLTMHFSSNRKLLNFLNRYSKNNREKIYRKVRSCKLATCAWKLLS